MMTKIQLNLELYNGQVPNKPSFFSFLKQINSGNLY